MAPISPDSSGLSALFEGILPLELRPASSTNSNAVLEVPVCTPSLMSQSPVRADASNAPFSSPERLFSASSLMGDNESLSLSPSTVLEKSMGCLRDGGSLAPDPAQQGSSDIPGLSPPVSPIPYRCAGSWQSPLTPSISSPPIVTTTGMRRPWEASCEGDNGFTTEGRTLAAQKGSSVDECCKSVSPPSSLRSFLQASGSEARCASVSMWSLADFEIGSRIGAGSFGHLELAREVQSKQLVVLKVMKKRRIERLRMSRHVKHEIEIQAHLQHPCILRLFGFFWDHSRIYMILEHAPKGDLARLLRKLPDGLEESRAAKLAAQLVSAIGYCHSKHVIHRDLKPQNLLIAERMRLKIADFGWAVHTYPDELRWTTCGTLDYFSPEMVRASGHSFGVDLWSIGAVTCELLIGMPPFAARTREETFRSILSADGAACLPARFLPRGIGSVCENGVAVSAAARDFVAGFLRRAPEDRLCLKDAGEHEWFKRAVERGTRDVDESMTKARS